MLCWHAKCYLSFDMKMQQFEKMTTWQKAHELAVSIYEETGHGVLSRDFPLKNQLRRAAISVPSNIAEGYGRHSKKEFLKYLSIANGSLFEVRSQVRLARDVGYMSNGRAHTLNELCLEVSRLIGGLRRSIESSL